MDFKKIRIIVLAVILSYPATFVFSDTIYDAIGLIEKKEYQKSIQVLDYLIENNTEYSIAYTYRGYVYMILGKYDLALRDYQSADAISSTLDSLLGIQWALLGLEKYQESAEVGNKILELDENNYYARQRIADSYLERREYKKASEKYKEMQSRYGNNADILWKLGLCEYYTGNTEEAKKNFEEGNKLSPEHKGIQKGLSGGLGGYPYIYIYPEYSPYSFKGSDFLGKGEKYGIGLSYSPNETWNFRGNVLNDRTENLNSTKGVENYLLDPINLLYISRLPPTASVAGYYLNSPYNLYNLYNLLESQDYHITKYSAGLSYKINERVHFHLSPHVLKSNSNIVNGASALQMGISYTNYYTFSFSGATISTPQNKGGQVSFNLYYPLMEKFYSSTTVTAQSMNVNTTETILLSATPLIVTTDTVNVNKNYFSAQQEIGYSYKYFYVGFGGRYGTARTPLIGENWVYTGFDLLYGGYGQIGIKTEKLTFQLQLIHDKWLDSREEKPVSNALKFTLIWRL